MGNDDLKQLCSAMVVTLLAFGFISAALMTICNNHESHLLEMKQKHEWIMMKSLIEPTRNKQKPEMKEF